MKNFFCCLFIKLLSLPLGLSISVKLNTDLIFTNKFYFWYNAVCLIKNSSNEKNVFNYLSNKISFWFLFSTCTFIRMSIRDMFAQCVATARHVWTIRAGVVAFFVGFHVHSQIILVTQIFATYKTLARIISSNFVYRICYFWLYFRYIYTLRF